MCTQRLLISKSFQNVVCKMVAIGSMCIFALCYISRFVIIQKESNDALNGKWSIWCYLTGDIGGRPEDCSDPSETHFNYSHADLF